MHVRPGRPDRARPSGAAATAAFLCLALTALGAAPATAVQPLSPSPTLASPSGGSARSLGGPVVYAHRGASAYAPENTLESIDRARALGFDWVENDVQRTRDGVLVVIHDDTLTRTTDVKRVFPDRGPWRVKDFTAAEIARLDAGSWFDKRFAGARVPTLREYMERVGRNRQRLLLELKEPEAYPGIERQILDLLDELGWLDEPHVTRRLVVQSFSADSIRTVHALRPDLRTAFLGTPNVADLPRYAAFTDQINPQHTTISAGWVAAVHRLLGAHGKPMEVDTWIVDDAATARKVKEMGVDGIITNAPDVVRHAVGPLQAFG
ncbi:glycerophosphodiester phosphodiesterase [Streptomyces sp. NPDC088348]|uniref:glycerophosphodiester phosphodiesterase n=1 Tax=Streptomyces sp. NPDC088348 TaxID=3365853 RepID=UPI00382CE2F6